jgi:phage replication O-like protein O
MEENFTRIANEILEALARTNLTAHEWRVVWCILRKTYGFQKKEDWIAVGQISEMTGLHKAHVSRAKKLLHLRNIVTPRGNKIGFNKYSNTWKELPHGVNDHSKSKTVTPSGNTVTPRGISELPHGADTKETLTKETYTKERPREKSRERTDERSTDEIGRAFRRVAVENQWCDDHYADKTWDQGAGMSERQEFFRKVRLLLAWANVPSRREKARVLFHEIAGFVNDRGAMQSKLTVQEKAARELFREETGQSLDDA